MLPNENYNLWKTVGRPQLQQSCRRFFITKKTKMKKHLRRTKTLLRPELQWRLKIQKVMKVPECTKKHCFNLLIIKTIILLTFEILCWQTDFFVDRLFKKSYPIAVLLPPPYRLTFLSYVKMNAFQWINQTNKLDFYAR